MYSNSDGGFGASNCGDNQDQWWFLEVKHDSNDNYYRIKNKQSGQCVYSNSDGRFSVSTCNTHSDQYWTFDQRKADDDNYFKIKNYQSKLRIIINNGYQTCTDISQFVNLK